MREVNPIPERLSRFSCIVQTMKGRFVFLRNRSYPENIFVHRSEIAADVLDRADIGTDVGPKVQFNRANQGVK
jgi:hypothetical protein